MQMIYFATTESFFDKTITLQLCKPLLKSVLDALVVTKLRTKEGTEAEYNALKSLGCAQPQFLAFTRDGLHTKPEMFIGPAVLADCLTRCIQLDWDDLARLFSLKLAATIIDAPPVELRCLWVPFVRELIYNLNATNVPLSTPRYHELACSILEAYLDKGVGMEPSGAEDYSGQGPAPYSCADCADCADLNRFLASGERVWHFFANKDRRKHVESRLGYAPTSKIGFSCHTNRVGNRWELVVKKMTDMGAKTKREWTDRYTQARDEFSKFHHESLMILLGEDYERIMSMRDIRVGAQARARRAPPAMLGAGANAGNSMRPTNVVAGVKRRAE